VHARKYPTTVSWVYLDAAIGRVSLAAVVKFQKNPIINNRILSRGGGQPHLVFQPNVKIDMFAAYKNFSQEERKRESKWGKGRMTRWRGKEKKTLGRELLSWCQEAMVLK
jgi:hypothetical protein